MLKSVVVLILLFISCFAGAKEIEEKDLINLEAFLEKDVGVKFFPPKPLRACKTPNDCELVSLEDCRFAPNSEIVTVTKGKKKIYEKVSRKYCEKFHGSEYFVLFEGKKKKPPLMLCIDNLCALKSIPSKD